MYGQVAISMPNIASPVIKFLILSDIFFGEGILNIKLLMNYFFS